MRLVQLRHQNAPYNYHSISPNHLQFFFVFFFHSFRHSILVHSFTITSFSLPPPHSPNNTYYHYYFWKSKLLILKPIDSKSSKIMPVQFRPDRTGRGTPIESNVLSCLNPARYIITGACGNEIRRSRRKNQQVWCSTEDETGTPSHGHAMNISISLHNGAQIYGQ